MPRKKKDNKSRYSDEIRNKAINRVTSGNWSYEKAAKEAGCAIETVCYWTARKAGFKNTNEWRAARSPHNHPLAVKKDKNQMELGLTIQAGELPTAKPHMPKINKWSKAKPLVSTGHACGWCGGPISLPNKE